MMVQSVETPEKALNTGNISAGNIQVICADADDADVHISINEGVSGQC